MLCDSCRRACVILMQILRCSFHSSLSSRVKMMTVVLMAVSRSCTFLSSAIVTHAHARTCCRLLPACRSEAHFKRHTPSRKITVKVLSLIICRLSMGIISAGNAHMSTHPETWLQELLRALRHNSTADAQEKYMIGGTTLHAMPKATLQASSYDCPAFPGDNG